MNQKTINLLFIILILNLATPILAKVFTVTNTNDSGAGSFRQAILDSNSNPKLDTIEFNIQGTGPFVIKPDSPLPTLTSPVIIDGYSQPGTSQATATSNGTLLIVINGGNLTGDVDGLTLDFGSDGSTIKGLVLQAFPGNFSAIFIKSSINKIQGNYIGTDYTGTIVTPETANSNQGITVFDSVNNIIGGSNIEERNLISGNETAIELHCQNMIVAGNILGLDITGTKALPNNIGITIEEFAVGNLVGGSDTGAKNIISGNTTYGIFINGKSKNVRLIANNIILGNYIGTDITGTKSLPNLGGGINVGFINDPLKPSRILNNLITCNLITGNKNFGISLNGPFVRGIAVLTNSIFDNNGNGIILQDGANNNQAAPILTEALTTGATLLVSGKLTSTPNSKFKIEFFINPVNTNFTEGKTFVGNTDITTDNSGEAKFNNIRLQTDAKVGQFISATATNNDSGTSEFSQNFIISQGPKSNQESDAIFGKYCAKKDINCNIVVI